MERKYSHELLEKLSQRQVVKQINGIEVLVKRLPDSDELGEMDARLHKDMKAQLAIMKLMPKGLIKMDASPKSIATLRKMFNATKSIPVVTADLDIKNTTIKAADGADIPIRIYRSKEQKQNSPVLLYFHGGGFFGGSVEVVDEAMKLICSNEKIPIVSVNYRLAPENPYPTGHEDCYSALKWLYSNAESIGAAKEKIVVSGDSAGGNLTLYCSMKDRESGAGMVRAQMLLYPTVNMGGIEDDLVKWGLDKYDIAKKHKSAIETTLITFGSSTANLGEILGVKDVKNPYLTPYMADLTNMPPTLVTVGEHDFLRVECLAFAVKLSKAGVKTKTILYNGFGHAYIDNIGVYPQSEDCAIEMGKYIMEICS